MFADKAPITVKNFLQYADEHFYDGTIFHRVIPNFMIQGGGMVPGFTEKKGRAPIKYEENNLRHVRGMIAMARAAAPDSGTSQFFINVVDLPHLDKIKPGYTVFGKIINGMEVVDKIKAVPTGNRAIHQNVPVEDVVIKAIRRASHFAIDTGAGAFDLKRAFTDLRLRRASNRWTVPHAGTAAGPEATRGEGNSTRGIRRRVGHEHGRLARPRRPFG